MKHQCPWCDHMASTVQLLVEHVALRHCRTYNEKKVLCPVCGLIVSRGPDWDRAYYLRRHMVSASGSVRNHLNEYTAKLLGLQKPKENA